MSLKLFGKNAVVYAIGNVGLRAASFLLIPLYTHSLSMKNYGLLMTLLLTTQFMLIVMNCGMRACLVRFTKEYEKNNRISVLLGTSCFVNILGGLVVTGVLLTLLIPFFRGVLHSENVYLYVSLSCGVSLLQSLSIHIMAYYRARNESIKFMVAGIVAAGILFAASYTFLYILHMGIIGALLAKIATYAIILLLISFDVFSRTGIRISFALLPKLMRFGLPLVFSMSSEFVIIGASIYFLSLLSGLEAVAIYSLGHKLAAVLAIVLILPFQQSFGPFVFANIDSPQVKKQMSQLLTYLVFAISVVSFCILFGSRLLLPLIAPPEYSSAYIVILLLLPGMAFIGMYYFAETLLKTVRKTHIIGLTMTVCALFSVTLNYVLIRFLGWYGAIIATNVSFILVGSILLIVGEKRFPIPIEWRRLGVAVGLFLAVIILNLVLLTVNNSNYYWISIMTICAMGCILHFGSFYDEREKLLLRNVVEKVKTILPGFQR
jgi:O-antigen/teichoic acid export membrane protein